MAGIGAKDPRSALPVEGVPLTEEERAQQMQRQAIDEFKVFLAKKVDFGTRVELLLGADYFWQETDAAVRFELDDRTFILAKKGDGACLCEKDRENVVVLLADDQQFEDRLLVAIGSMLDNGCRFEFRDNRLFCPGLWTN